MARTLRTLDELAAAELIPAEAAQVLAPVASRYAVAITPAMTELAQRSEGVARQFVPALGELDSTPDESEDPVGDAAFSPVEGVVHRYRDRVLLKVNHACAVYCRFCFRREMVGPDGPRPLSPAQLDAAMAYIAGRPEIWEVIVTGGDPFVLSPRRLRDLMTRLAAIGHVKVVRFHTRVPAVAPERITAELVRALRTGGKSVWVALHANHPDELNPACAAAVGRLVDAGVPILSQSVLLKGINDDPATLEALMRRFVELRVKPYYLHHMDKAPGTAAFRTSIEAGQALAKGLRGDVSGLCQPVYVLDIPGGHGKVPLTPAGTTEGGVVDRKGRHHPYPLD